MDNIIEERRQTVNTEELSVVSLPQEEAATRSAASTDVIEHLKSQSDKKGELKGIPSTLKERQEFRFELLMVQESFRLFSIELKERRFNQPYFVGYRDALLNLMSKISESRKEDTCGELEKWCVEQFVNIERSTDIKGPKANEMAEQNADFLTRTISKMSTCISGKTLLREIFNKRYDFNSEDGPGEITIATPLYEGALKYLKPVASAVNIGDETLGVSELNRQSSCKTTPLESGAFSVSKGTTKNAIVYSQPMELGRVLNAATAPYKGSGADFENIDVTLLGHEMIHALHTIYGVRLVDVRDATTDAHSSSLEDLFRGSLQIPASDGAPAEPYFVPPTADLSSSAEELVTAGVKAVGGKCINRDANSVMRALVPPSLKAAFLVSEADLRAEMNVPEGAGYVEKQSVAQVASGVLSEEMFVAFYVANCMKNIAAGFFNGDNTPDDIEGLSRETNKQNFMNFFMRTAQVEATRPLRERLSPTILNEAINPFCTGDDGQVDTDKVDRLCEVAYKAAEDSVDAAVEMAAKCAIKANKKSYQLKRR